MFDPLPDLGRLRLLVELSRLGTMAAVAERTGYGTSAVSKHLAVLEQEVGARLLAPVGRRVRLTPAGERLVEHAVGILARVEEARSELSGSGAHGPAGPVRLASFASAAEPLVVPALVRLRQEHPALDVHLYEHEPEQTLELLLAGDMDLALIYDYSLVPRAVPTGLSVRQFAEQRMLLTLPAGHGHDPGPGRTVALPELGRLAEAGWITNSRGSDDDELVRRVCALAGFTPRIVHRVDSLHLVNLLAGAGLGVALLAESGVERHRDDVVFRLLDPLVGTRRHFLVARDGQWGWPPIATVVRAVATAGGAAAG
jgi:DNA-binding transcriptional LysR family regulator